MNNSIAENIISVSMFEKGKNRRDKFHEYFGDCLFDSENHRFACLRKSCNNDCILFQEKEKNNNINFQILRLYSEDHNIWCNRIFPELLEFLSNFSAEEINNCRFSFNHRYICGDNFVVQFLHEGKFLFENGRGFPVLKIRTFTEIDDIKTDESIVLSVFKYFNDEGYKKIFSKTYMHTSDLVLSSREIEIIKLCYEGLSSKQIAEKLCLSIHTVKNHKRNSMKKTGTHNINQLINFCFENAVNLR